MKSAKQATGAYQIKSRKKIEENAMTQRCHLKMISLHCSDLQYHLH